MATKFALENLREFALDGLTKFNALAPSKKLLVSAGVFTGSSLAYGLLSFCYNKLRYAAAPQIHHTVHGDINDNAGILVFIHGFPDFEYLWQKQVAFFTAKGFCCITLELPNYRVDRVQNPWGYDFLTVTKALADQICYTLRKKPFTLIAHDWGALLSNLMYLDHRDRMNCERLVLLDVADGADQKDGQDMSKYAYQFKCAAAFVMPSWLGTFYVRRLFTMWPNMQLPILEQEKVDGRRYIHAPSCYLYYHFIRAALLGAVGLSGNLKALDIKSRLKEFAGLKILFVDAVQGDDPMVFYSRKFKAYIEGREDCEFTVMNASHWVQWYESQQLNDKMLVFIQK